jgi:hypothetical protein
MILDERGKFPSKDQRRNERGRCVEAHIIFAYVRVRGAGTEDLKGKDRKITLACITTRYLGSSLAPRDTSKRGWTDLFDQNMLGAR